MLWLAKCLFCSLRNDLAFELDFGFPLHRSIIPQWNFWDPPLLWLRDRCRQRTLYTVSNSPMNIIDTFRFSFFLTQHNHLLRLFGDGSNQTSSSSKLIHAQKIEPLTVSELNQYVLSADPQVIERNIFNQSAKSHTLLFNSTCWL